ncbi:hypothetical protein PMI08_00290 [Brevibacillus sp. CF112]|nr:hypothetical protein PMI08_00290 [Brevibacillus sp. CF112]
MFVFPALFAFWKDISHKMLNDKDDGEFRAGGT